MWRSSPYTAGCIADASRPELSAGKQRHHVITADAVSFVWTGKLGSLGTGAPDSRDPLPVTLPWSLDPKPNATQSGEWERRSSCWREFVWACGLARVGQRLSAEQGNLVGRLDWHTQLSSLRRRLCPAFLMARAILQSGTSSVKAPLPHCILCLLNTSPCESSFWGRSFMAVFTV